MKCGKRHALKIIVVMHVFLRSNERKAWKILRGLKHITSARPNLRIGHEFCNESKRTEFCKKEHANVSSQLKLCSFSCYAVRKWSVTSLSKLNAYHSAISKQKHIQVTSWLASDKILSSIIIK